MNDNRPASEICPICGCGRLAPMTLMDAYSCTLCLHMFSWTDHEKCLEVLDASMPKSWSWNGHQWQRKKVVFQSMTAAKAMFIGFTICLPVVMIVVAGYVFWHLPNSPFTHLIMLWAAMSLIVHGGLVAWTLFASDYLSSHAIVSVQIREFFA